MDICSPATNNKLPNSSTRGSRGQPQTARVTMPAHAATDYGDRRAMDRRLRSRRAAGDMAERRMRCSQGGRGRPPCELVLVRVTDWTIRPGWTVLSVWLVWLVWLVRLSLHHRFRRRCRRVRG